MVVVQVLLYAGFVLLAGTLAFWMLVWGEGTRDRRLVLLAEAGVLLLAVATIAAPVVRWAGSGAPLVDVVSREDGTAALLRLALLAGTAGFFTDLVRGPVVGVRRVAAGLVAVGLALTMVAQSDAVEGPIAWLTALAVLAHLLAAATWLGGLAALAVVILPGEHVPELEGLVPTFSRTASVSVGVLVVTGVVHARVVADGPGDLTSSRYGAALLVKALLVGCLLVIGTLGRRRARAATMRQPDRATAVWELGAGSGVRALGVVVGAELVTAVAILVATAVLVSVAPFPR